MRARTPAHAARFLSLFVCCWLLPAGCSRGPSEQPADATADARIVSLLPSATLTLVGAGHGDRIVGVGEHDPAAERLLPRGTPRVGSFLDVDDERLAALRPTRVVAPEGTRLRLPAGAELLEQPHPAGVEEAAANVEALGDPDAAAAIRAAFRVPGVAAGGAPPRVLLAFGTSPVWASGPGTVNDEVLRAAGGRNALADAAVPAVTLDEEALLGLAPDLVLLLLPGRDLAEAEAERAELEATLRGGGVACRVEALTDPFVLLPGPNLPETLGLFREALWGAERGE